jgi:hypothetical protein
MAGPAALVSIKSSDATDPAPYELRLRSELAAEGIDAIVANAAGGEPKQLASRMGANCIVEVTVSQADLNATVWISDSTLALEVTRSLHMSNHQRDSVGVFALRTVDFLLGAQLELEQQRRAKLAQSASSGAPGATSSPATSEAATVAAPSKPKEESRRPAAPSAVPIAARVDISRPGQPIVVRPSADGPSPESIRLDIGYSVLISSSRFVWATAPVLALAYFPFEHWGIGATLAGPFINHVEATTGNYRITVDQEALELNLRGRWPLSEAWFFEPKLGLGVSRYAADGTDARPPAIGVRAAAWSVLTVAGASLSWRWSKHLRWVTDVSGLMRWQNPFILLDGQQRTGNSRWNVLVRMGPGWSF